MTSDGLAQGCGEPQEARRCPEEERYVTIGMSAIGEVLVVVYTWRGDEPRLISARRAMSQERELYGVKA